MAQLAFGSGGYRCSDTTFVPYNPLNTQRWVGCGQAWCDCCDHHCLPHRHRYYEDNGIAAIPVGFDAKRGLACV